MTTVLQDADADLPFTGERYVPQVNGGIALEHWHRYLMAAPFAAGRDVLDVACGEGYGSAHLALTAASVTGVDISDEAVGHATRRYRLPNLSFRQGDAAAIPLPDASVDLVTSFETIEHHDRHAEMFAEIKRVLRPGGIMVMSSPDKREYSDIGQANNPHHVKELYRDEFDGLVAGHFAHHAMFGQRIVFGSGLFLEGGTSVIETHTLAENGWADPVQAKGMARPVYLVAVASDAPLPPLTSSFFEQRLDLAELAVCWQRMDADLTDARVRKIAELSASLDVLSRQLEESRREAETLRRQSRPGLLRRLFG